MHIFGDRGGGLLSEGASVRGGFCHPTTVYVSKNKEQFLSILIYYPLFSFKIWIMELTRGRWELLTTARQDILYQAGLVHHDNGDVELVTAGGDTESSTKIFSLSKRQWRTLKTGLPMYDLYAATTVPHDNTFYIVGGMTHEQSIFDRPKPHRHILEFDEETGRWQKFHKKIRIASTKENQYAAFIVPSNYIDC